jgi:hypothetical protein
MMDKAPDRTDVNDRELTVCSRRSTARLPHHSDLRRQVEWIVVLVRLADLPNANRRKATSPQPEIGHACKEGNGRG